MEVETIVRGNMLRCEQHKGSTMPPSFMIKFFGYESGTVEYRNKTEARKALADFKREDKAACRKRFGTAKVTNTKDSYKIEFGCNLYSAAAIVYS